MSGPFVSSVSRRPNRLRNALVIVAVLAAGAAVLAAVYGGLWYVDREEIPARTTIGGVQVGGLSEEQAADRVAAAARQQVARPIRLIGPGGVDGTTGKRIGATPLVTEALAQAAETTGLERAWRRLGFGDTREVPLRFALGPVRTARLANHLDERFADPPRNADVVVRGTDVRVRPAAPGTG
ncbi:MAG: hypothetical protein ACRC50_10565, partial [Gaiella sp.]